MKKLLIVSATYFEVKPLLERFGVIGKSDKVDSLGLVKTENQDVDLCISGVGQLQSAYHLAEALAQQQYRIALNFGICGSFKEEIPQKSVVNIISEELSDLGAEDNGSYLDLFEMGFLKKDKPPFVNAALLAKNPKLQRLEQLPQVKSLTVNRVLAHQDSIEFVREKYNPDVVNMEGAAFFYACKNHGLECAAVRSVSDYVGPRDKAKWDIPGAVEVLNSVALGLVEEILKS